MLLLRQIMGVPKQKRIYKNAVYVFKLIVVNSITDM